jgi:hypothetical protein
MKMFQVSSLLGLFTAVSVFCAFFLQSAQADIILAHWGFDTYPSGGNVDTADYLASYVTNGAFLSSGAVTPAVVAGTTLGAGSVYTATQAPNYQRNGTGLFATFTLTLAVNTNVSNLTISQLGYAYNSGKATTAAWSYQIGTNTSVSIGSSLLNSSGFATVTNALSILVSGGQIITFTAALNRTATGNAATIFDNIDLRYSSITPVPEPGSCVFLGVLGLIMFGVRAGRNCWARLRRA